MENTIPKRGDILIQKFSKMPCVFWAVDEYDRVWVLTKTNLAPQIVNLDSYENSGKSVDLFSFVEKEIGYEIPDVNAKDFWPFLYKILSDSIA